MTYKAKKIMVTKKKIKKSLHVLEDGTNDVQVGDIKQVIV